MVAGIDILGVSTLLAMASHASAATVQACARVPAPPTVQVLVVEEDVRIFNDKSAKELSVIEARHGSDLSQAFFDDGHAVIGGLTSGNVSVEHKVLFRVYNDERSGFGCVAFEHVEVTLRLAPTVYIAKEFRDNACRFREIYTHEMAHVATDRQVLARYRARMTDGLNMLFAVPDDYATGVIAASDIESEKTAMKRVMDNAVGVLFDDLQRDRGTAQRRIDSPQEYNRIRRACR